MYTPYSSSHDLYATHPLLPVTVYAANHGQPASPRITQLFQYMARVLLIAPLNSNRRAAEIRVWAPSRPFFDRCQKPFRSVQENQVWYAFTAQPCDRGSVQHLIGNAAIKRSLSCA